MYLAIDIGGTKTLAAVFSETGEIIERQKFKTPANFEEFLSSLKSAAEQFSTKKFRAGCVGVRGLVDRTSGSLVKDGLLGWQNIPLSSTLGELFLCDFKVENDAKLAGLSEARLSGSGYSRVLYITISTGINSAYIVNGNIDYNLANSEIGHWLFEHEGTIQTWENFASGKTIVEKYGKRAAELEDPLAWETVTKNMALGIINAAAAYTPDLIIIGGGVGSHFHKFEAPLSNIIASLAPDLVKIPPIKQAQNAEEAVIYGCYELIRQN